MGVRRDRRRTGQINPRVFVSIRGEAVRFTSYGGTIGTTRSYFRVLPTRSRGSQAESASRPREQPDRGFARMAAD